MSQIDEYKQTEVTYTFFLPGGREELQTFQNANRFSTALHDIHELCRSTWKYKEDATEEEIKLAERIDEIVFESGVFDDE